MRWIATLLAAFACLGQARAHVLDEYLQATYIAVGPGQIDVEIDLTPGVEVFQKVLALIDRDGDGKITDEEIRAYAGIVLSEVRLDLDGAAKRLQFAHAALPPRADLEDGLGTIRIQATAGIDTLAAGPHHLGYTNAHAAEISAYLVNTLVPSSSAIRITKQTRDEFQRGYRMEFEVLPSGRVEFTGPVPKNFQIWPLPGHPEFVFTMYGAPGELDSAKQLVQVMRDRGLGNGFDPGPTPNAHTRPVFDYLAAEGWPVMCYPGCADMQIKGGRCVLGRENEAALAAIDRAGVFNAVQLGEWGYYFHNLSMNEPWWRDVYGKDFDDFKHLIKPAGLAGYDRHPASRRECYETIKDYFTSRSRDLLGRVISVTGHSHYEAYAGEWGARCIGLEVGENIAFTQSKFAFARGASRQWRVPWSVQVSPWFAGACTTSGPLRTESGGARGLDAGHSLSFYERTWLHAWFAGAAMVTPENSIAIFFDKPSAPWTLTDHGRKAAEVFEFTRTHQRGIPFTPVAIVLDHLAGYNGYMDKPWGILEPTAGDLEVRDLFDYQLFPGSDHIHHQPDPDNPESSYMRPTPYGEMFDVQLTSASAEMLSSYPVILLAGDIEFDDEFVAKLNHALKQGSTVLLSEAHRSALGPRFSRLAKHPGVEILQPWTNPQTGRPAAISDLRLKRLARESLPVEVGGDPIQYQVNRLTNGWVVEIINNTGAAKKPGQPATTDPGAIAKVALTPRIRCASAREWRAHRSYAKPEQLQVKVGPGQSEFVEFTCP